MLTPLAVPRPIPRTQPLEATIRASQLFAGVSPRSLSIIAGAAQRRVLSRGERIWEAGQTATHFTLVASGLVKILRRGADRGEFIVAVIGRASYPAACECASDRLSVLRIEAPPVLALMEADESVGAAARRGLLAHTRALQEKIDVMSAGSVPRRLARLLLGLAERFGDEREEGGTFVPLTLTRSELACLVGARVETTIRTLSRWQREGAISCTKDGFVILSPSLLSASASAA
jgi:CRP/FNR family transcriptional regulator, nitrogen oxide reductase regulator